MPDAEKSLLGSMMLDEGVVADVADFIQPEHFRDAGHRAVAEAIFRLHRDPVDSIHVVAVAKMLESWDRLDEAGGPAGLAELLESVPHAGHAIYYATVVRERYVQSLANDAAPAPDEHREYLRLTEDRHGCYKLGWLDVHGDTSGDDLVPPIVTLTTGFCVHMDVERATALRDALTRWLMDVEAAGG